MSYLNPAYIPKHPLNTALTAVLPPGMYDRQYHVSAAD
jgi:hypothetical protein